MMVGWVGDTHQGGEPKGLDGKMGGNEIEENRENEEREFRQDTWKPKRPRKFLPPNSRTIFLLKYLPPRLKNVYTKVDSKILRN